MIASNQFSHYIKVHNSPRSKVLPKELNLPVINLVLDIGLWKSLWPSTIFSIWAKIKVVGKIEAVLIEYDGNLFLNSQILLLLCFFKRAYVTLDCHNSAVEYQSEHRARYILNQIYLGLLFHVFRVRLIVHNKAMKTKYLPSDVFETPYPKFDFDDEVQKEFDVIFLCSLNSDEPLDLIIDICKELQNRGAIVKITGDSSKLNIDKSFPFFFPKYLSYDEYIAAIRKSQIAVCLTSRKNTLLFSPREAISLGVPCLVNDNNVNREFYGSKVVYASLTKNGILDMLGDL